MSLIRRGAIKNTIRYGKITRKKVKEILFLRWEIEKQAIGIFFSQQMNVPQKIQ